MGDTKRRTDGTDYDVDLICNRTIPELSLNPSEPIEYVVCARTPGSRLRVLYNNPTINYTTTMSYNYARLNIDLI
jgi:hypothetical protein